MAIENSSDWNVGIVHGPAMDSAAVDHRTRNYALVAVICIILVSLSQYTRTKRLRVNVPLEGTSGIISSYFAAWHFLQHTNSILRQAYAKYGRATFRVPELDHLTVVVNRTDVIDELRKAPDNKFSLPEATVETLASSWTFGENIVRDPYHANVIRNQLTRSLVGLFNDIRDEITQAFNELIPASGSDEWVAIPAVQVMRNVVCRTSNRIFVGLPLCRDPDYIDLNIEFTTEVIQNIYRYSLTPVFLRPIVGKFFSTTPRSIRRGLRHLRPIFEERFRLFDEHDGEDWSDKPNDMITWLIEDAPENERRNIYELTKRMLLVNFAAIHTSSNSFTHALYHLAAETQYIEPLREEIERVIKEDGWTKIAMTKMWKLDSFLKESQRLNGIFNLTLNRMAMTDHTLLDGTFLPAGTYVSANIAAVQHDDTYYPEADKFDGFRFAKIRGESAEESLKHQMVNTSSDYIAFGHGRRACPGRFFAVNELKAMMAYLLMNYDLKAEVEGVRPENVHMGVRLIPNPTAKVLLKKRLCV